MNDMWHSAVVDFRCISFRFVWSKFKFSRVKVCAVVGYGPNEGIGDETERFWNYPYMTVDRVGNGYKLCMLGDLHRWIGDRVRVGNWCFWSSKRERKWEKSGGVLC